MAHNLYGIAYQFYGTNSISNAYVTKDIFVSFSIDFSSANRAKRAVGKVYSLWNHRKRCGNKPAPQGCRMYAP